MANLQVKGIEDVLYAKLRNLAEAENRSISQEVIFLLKRYLATWEEEKHSSPAEALLRLAGSWEDDRPAAEIIRELKGARRKSRKLARGF